MNAQTQKEVMDSFKDIDSLYREDQFYLGGTFHLLNNRPTGISQTSFSGGIHLGFIRDFPINRRRNIGFGLGLGYSSNVYNQDLLILPKTSSSGTVFREATAEDNLESNRFYTHLIEVPIELRWRTSTPTSYKFWRIYAGMKLGYMHYFRSRFVSREGETFIDKTPDGLDRLRLGTHLSFGWNTFNFYFYYCLNDLFDETVSIVDQRGSLEIIKIGLMFYIL